MTMNIIRIETAVILKHNWLDMLVPYTHASQYEMQSK